MSESKNSKKTGHRFEPGNKHGHGRPEGSRNKATVFLQKLMTDDAEAIVRKVIELAKVLYLDKDGGITWEGFLVIVRCVCPEVMQSAR